MVRTIQAKNVTLRTLIEDFNIQLVRDRQFFPEWQTDLPAVSNSERQFLDRISDGFINLLSYPPLLEGVIRMSVVDPLLFLAGVYLPPFHVRSELSIALETEDEGILIKGSLDTVVISDRLWVLVVESKRATYSVEAGLAQILAYMLANPHPEPPCYGMITDGSSFMFIKTVTHPALNHPPYYATSKLFGIRAVEDLYQTFAILRRLGQLVEA